MTYLIALERDGYGATLSIRNSGSLWAVRFTWLADCDLGAEGYARPYDDRAQAICAGVRALLESLGAADRDQAEHYRPNPAVTGVARQRMERIREWAEALAAKHRPVARTVPLFGEGA